MHALGSVSVSETSAAVDMDASMETLAIVKCTSIKENVLIAIDSIHKLYNWIANCCLKFRNVTLFTPVSIRDNLVYVYTSFHSSKGLQYQTGARHDS